MSYQDLFSLQDKVAVITGSSRGIGKAIAEAMAAAGAKVVISSRKAAPCEAVAEAINAGGGEAMALACNISEKAQLRALVDGTIERWGRIDALVCNAAVNPYFGPLAEITDEAYDKTMNTNLRSNLWLCNMVIPQMATRGGGAVILISSIAAFKGHGNLGVYALSKAADNQLARSLAVEWGRSNLRVNCIAPGLVRTDMARALWEDPDRLAQALESYPLGRIGEPEDIAGAAVFLASRAGNFVTGQTLVIDGGTTVMGGRYT
ncbi:MAG: SDR family oxidoreductase [Proteobacteria bacterium]|nr:SDR family oxidoreductase [Pseudomonadota bacterium]